MEKSEKEYLEELAGKIAELEHRIVVLENGSPTPSPVEITEPIDIMADEVSFVVPIRKQELGITEKPVRSEPSIKVEQASMPAEPKKTATPVKVSKPEVKLAWMVDTPASPLSNIMSGIALKDRSVFINSLFRENPQLFVDTISVFNAMTSFAEAEEYVYSNFPEWNLSSAVVYRLMMAIRRKLN